MNIPTRPSSIWAVTVYHAGARITRRVALEGHSGDQLKVTGLPLALDDGSVRARLEGASEELTVRGVQVAVEVPGEAGGPKPPSEEELVRARRRRMVLERRVETVREFLHRLEDLTIQVRPNPEEKEPPPSPLEARLALTELTAARRRRLLASLSQLELDLLRAREEEAHLHALWTLESTERPVREDEIRKSVIVTLQSAAPVPGGVSLLVEYRIPGACWAPSYSLRLDRNLTRAELGVRAVVQQQTGEDWKDVALTLSTATDESHTELPELMARRIGRWQAMPPRPGWRSPPPGTEELFGDNDRARVRFRPPVPEAPPPPPPPAGRADNRRTMKSRSTGQQALTEGMMASRVMREDSFGAPGDVGMMAGGGGYPMVMEESELDDDLSMPMMASSAPMPAAAPAPRMAMSMSVSRSRAGASSRPGAPPPRSPPPQKPEMVVGADLLDYGRLRMAEIDSPRRGKLVPLDEVEVYLELTSITSVQVKAVIGTMLAQAGNSTGSAPALPPGYRSPDTIEGFDYAYRAERPVTVPSDPGYHTIPLLVREAPVAVRHVTVPRVSSEVYRVIRMTNPLDAPLPPGPADVSVGGDFLLTTPLGTIAPGAEAQIGLGMEEGIRVARRTKFKEQTSGLLKGQLSLWHSVSVDVRNNLSSRVEVEVRERIPVPSVEDKDLHVELTSVEPVWSSFDQPGHPVRGGHRWIFSLEPSAEQKLEAVYEIHLPSKNQVTGGNRRES